MPNNKKAAHTEMPTRGRAIFASIPDHWVPVAYAKDIRSGRPNAIHVDNVPVVLWRAEAGLHALVDQCPHRSVKLSVGKITSEGAIQCAFQT